MKLDIKTFEANIIGFKRISIEFFFFFLLIFSDAGYDQAQTA